MADGLNGVAVVTGAAGNLGTAICRVLAKRGVGLVAVDVDPDRLGALPGRLKVPVDGIATVVADVSTPDGVEAYVATARERFHRIDFLVNNAGAHGPYARIDETSTSQIASDVAITLMSQILGTATMGKEMVRNGSGRIVNIGSTNSFAGLPGVVPYTAAKHGSVGLTKSAALDLGPHGVRVNLVAPGFVPSVDGISRETLTKDGKSPEQAVQDIAALTPAGRPGEASEVAEVVEWLLLDAPDFLNGVIIPVDGGLSARIGMKG